MQLNGLHITIARSFRQRLLGLLGRRALAPDEALLLLPCSNIHTAWMRFAIDVVFLDREGTILSVSPDVRPWRTAATWHAHSCLELASGAAARHGLAPGQRWPQLAAANLAP
ncbi:DUF192 domain-containing protein [Duganella sp. P38]|jgi:uncharacterized membrane protein (UPF0127 family)|uniref:DUF192 domain-containing protein n=1 Tax=Duganella sp. P38 TaxID=3423949 RepID=UPI003D7C1232